MEKRVSEKTLFSLVPFSDGKRGMIELQFNWIFVLIAGAVIFVFFVNIVNKQTEFSEIKASGTIITNLESILTGAQASTRTVNLIEMPKADIGFECNRYFIGSVPKQTKSNVIFAPGLLKGKQMITWALDWNVPYRITNFLYITDPQVRYVIVYDSSTEALADKIDKELPKEMKKEKINDSESGSFVNKNNYKVKFIFLTDTMDTTMLTKLNKMPDKDVTAIKIDDATSSVIQNTGKIGFFQKAGGGWEEQESEGKKETYYLNKESLFGAIFAEDLEMYNCEMRKAFKKLNLVSTIYFNRSTDLAGYYGSKNMGCSAAHLNGASEIKNIIIKSDELSNKFPESGIGVIGDIKESAFNTENGIWGYNRNAQLFSCALIY